MMKQFKIVVPSFNSPDYLPKTLGSIERQDDADFQVCVIDDGSTMSVQREIIRDFCLRNGWKSQLHDKNYGALYGIVNAIREFDCNRDDVIVILDGDDWFAHDHVLSYLRRVYSENDLYLTWGQCEVYPRGTAPQKLAQPIPDMVIDQQLYRQIPFPFWHLRTFKYFLWQHIKDSDLRDEYGNYFRVLSDKAILFPMLEMAGHKVKFISETLCIYNKENPLNDYKTNYNEYYMKVQETLEKQPHYPVLDECQ